MASFTQLCKLEYLLWRPLWHMLKHPQALWSQWSCESYSHIVDCVSGDRELCFEHLAWLPL
eukprot:4064746-Amphidinium_carterae.1